MPSPSDSMQSLSTGGSAEIAANAGADEEYAVPRFQRLP
jgi:hypothetical protein